MKLPWIQVTEETWANASRLAALLDCDESKAFKLQCDLWRWGLDLGPADQPPEGICLSPRAARLLAAACCWPLARADELVGVFGDLGLVVPVDGGLRVCGLDRYHGTWRKNRGLNGAKTQEPAERRTEPERNPNGRRTEPPLKTQTQTQTHIPSASQTGAPQLALVGDEPEKPKAPKRRDPTEADPRHQPLVEALTLAFFRVRKAKYPFTPRDAVAVKALLTSCVPPPEIVTAWTRALQHVGYPSVATLSEFHDRLAHFVAQKPDARGQADPASGWSGTGEVTVTRMEPPP